MTVNDGLGDRGLELMNQCPDKVRLSTECYYINERQKQTLEENHASDAEENKSVIHKGFHRLTWFKEYSDIA